MVSTFCLSSRGQRHSPPTGIRMQAAAILIPEAPTTNCDPARIMEEQPQMLLSRQRNMKTRCPILPYRMRTTSKLVCAYGIRILARTPMTAMKAISNELAAANQNGAETPQLYATTQEKTEVLIHIQLEKTAAAVKPVPT